LIETLASGDLRQVIGAARQARAYLAGVLEILAAD
jgi:hypothetical protein